MFCRACFTVLVLAALCRAGPIRIAQQGAVLEIDGAPGNKMRLSGRLTIHCRIENGRGAERDAIPLKADEKIWQVAEDTLTPGPLARRIVLEPLQPGSLQLPSIGIRFRDGPGHDWTTAIWSGLSVEVAGPPVAEAGTVRGETPIESLPETPSLDKFPFGPLLLIGVPIVALLAVALLWRLLERPRGQPVLPPDREALRAIESLKDVPAPHARLSSALRQYAEARFAVPATRQTTEEVIEGARAQEALTPELCGELESLLRECDRVKFAGGESGPGETEALLALARGWIEQTTRAMVRGERVE